MAANYRINSTALAADIKRWGQEYGFAQVGISGIDLAIDAERLHGWLAEGYQGEMHYLEKHERLRSDANSLMPNTRSIICCRVNYAKPNGCLLNQNNNLYHGSIAAFAHGNDYHKSVRRQLLAFAKRIHAETGQCNYRVFCGSAPVLEKALAAKAGLGWIGKNGLLINADDGSYSFLGEIFTELPLPIDEPSAQLCGDCKNCLKACPTQALIMPYKLDARRCLAYLTIENRGSIPEEFRSAIKNKIFGCDECQIVCPWNHRTKNFEPHISPTRQSLVLKPLAELLLWDEKTFRENSIGTALCRISHECWIRNIAVAIGNSGEDKKNLATNITALSKILNHRSQLVLEHVHWALSRLTNKS